MNIKNTPLLLNTSPLVLLPELAVALGLNEAIVLQQLHYLIRLSTGKKGHLHEGRWWTWQTHEDWQRQFPWWSVGTIRRIFTNLTKNLKVVLTGQFSRPPDTTLWYTIDYDAYENLVKQCDSKDDRLGDQFDHPSENGAIGLIVRGDQVDRSGRSNRSNNIDKTTSEITYKDYSLPLTPSQEQKEKKEKESELINTEPATHDSEPKSEDKIEPQSLSKPPDKIQSLEHQIDSDRDKSSASVATLEFGTKKLSQPSNHTNCSSAPTDTLNKADLIFPASPPIAKKLLEHRRYNPQKGIVRSCASDPWMESENNPDRMFKHWLHVKRKQETSRQDERNQNYVPTLPNIASEIRNDAARASDLWEEFLLEMRDRVDNFRAREAAGLTISEEERQGVESILPYAEIAATSLPHLPVTPVAVEVLPPAQQCQTYLPNSGIAANLAPEGAENYSAYTVVRQEPIMPEVSTQNYAQLCRIGMEKIKNRMSMPFKSKFDSPQEPETLVEKYRSYIKSGEPALVKEAVLKVKANPSLELVYDDRGEIPVDVDVAF